MQTIQAKMMVASVSQVVNGQEVRLYPIYSPDPADPNYSYSVATPSGELKLMITNPNLVGAFKKGQVYFVDLRLEETPEDQPLPQVRELPVPDLPPVQQSQAQASPESRSEPEETSKSESHTSETDETAQSSS